MISIIIPLYKGKDTIIKTLNSIRNSTYKDYEIIIVHSFDGVKYNFDKEVRLVNLKEQVFPGKARNIGFKHTKGEILLFLDSDIIIPTKLLSEIKEIKDKEIIQTIYSENCPVDTFVSQYQNFYQNYYMLKMRNPKTICGHCLAIKKKDFVPFPETQYSEDISWGLKLSDLGYNISLRKDLDVEHNKFFSFNGLLKRSYNMGKHKIKMKDFNKQIKTKNSFHSREKIWSIILSPFPIVFWFIGYGFFKYIKIKKNFLFLFKVIVFHQINCLFFLLGIVRGIYDRKNIV